MATGPFQGGSKSLCPCSAGSRGPIKAPGLIPRAETLPAVFRVSAPPFQGLESFPSKNGEAWKSWSGHFIPLCPPAQTASMCWVLRSEGRQGPGFLGLLEAALASGVQLRGPQGRSSQANPILRVSPLQPLGGTTGYNLLLGCGQGLILGRQPRAQAAPWAGQTTAPADFPCFHPTHDGLRCPLSQAGPAAEQEARVLQPCIGVMRGWAGRDSLAEVREQGGSHGTDEPGPQGSALLGISPLLARAGRELGAQGLLGVLPQEPH